MTKRAVKLLAPFDFRADFGPQPEQVQVTGEPARISFSGEEIACLIAQVRAEALAEAERRQTVAESERLAGISRDLAGALGEIVQVMSQIEAASYDTETEARLRALIEGAAARLLRGQGDLFAELKDRE